jgi:hypothetical protein
MVGCPRPSTANAASIREFPEAPREDAGVAPLSALYLAVHPFYFIEP